MHHPADSCTHRPPVHLLDPVNPEEPSDEAVGVFGHVLHIGRQHLYQGLDLALAGGLHARGGGMEGEREEWERSGGVSGRERTGSVLTRNPNRHTRGKMGDAGEG